MGDRCTPFFAPEYWNRDEVAPLVDDNPFHAARSGGSASAAAAGPVGGAPAAPAAVQRMWSSTKNPGLAVAFLIGCAIALWVVFFAQW